LPPENRKESVRPSAGALAPDGNDYKIEENLMKISLAIQSLRSCTLEEAAGITRALGFEAMDLDGVMDTTLKREGILSLDRTEIQRVKDLGLIAPNIHWTFAPGSLYPAVNDPDPKVRADNTEQIKHLVEFCHAAGILSILVLPGMLLPGQGVADGRALSVEALNEYAAICRQANIALFIEPHVKCSFESPKMAAWLAQQVPDAKIALDFAHFICQGYTQPEVDTLVPYTGHVHLRQARSGLLQSKLEDGTINFGLVVDELRNAGYSGYWCVEYVHQDYIGADNVDVLTETVKMRDFLLSNLGNET
jgi:sugar phosphate isomerase/epimerase